MPKNENEIVRIELTPSQKETIKTATDKSAEAIELTVQELEAGSLRRSCSSPRVGVRDGHSTATHSPTTPRSDLVPDAALCFSWVTRGCEPDSGKAR